MAPIRRFRRTLHGRTLQAGAEKPHDSLVKLLNGISDIDDLLLQYTKDRVTGINDYPLIIKDAGAKVENPPKDKPVELMVPKVQSQPKRSLLPSFDQSLQCNSAVQQHRESIPVSNEWMDIRVGDPFPTRALIKAFGQSLNTVTGQNPDQYVALWYQQGEPVMGRVWNEGGKVAANFGWFNNEYNKNVGSIQLLVELPDQVRYAWKPFKEAALFGKKEWYPVHVEYHKGDISPCVLTVEGGKQILGKVDVRNERATVAFGGKEHIFVGPTVHSFVVLCRKARPGQKFD